MDSNTVLTKTDVTSKALHHTQIMHIIISNYSCRSNTHIIHIIYYSSQINYTGHAYHIIIQNFDGVELVI